MSGQTENINLNESTDASVSNGPKEKVAPLPGMIPIEAKVKIKKTVLEGVVKDYHLSKDKKSLTYMVEYTEDDVTHEKNFTHEQIEEIKEEQ